MRRTSAGSSTAILKPANIKLTANGDVKVLDFGLAKLADAVEPSGSAASIQADSPTMTSPALLTGVGAVLGTAAYMAPEQARGQAVDKRADIWAFGCILDEMLTGSQPFRGGNVAESLRAVMHDEPDWNALPAEFPGHVRALLRSCLAKDRRHRLRDIGDIRWDSEPPGALSNRRPSALWLAWGAATVIAAIAAIGWLRTPEDRASPSLTLTLVPPTGLVFNTMAQELSPDGSALAFYAFDQKVGGESQSGWYVRRLWRARSATRGRFRHDPGSSAPIRVS